MKKFLYYMFFSLMIIIVFGLSTLNLFFPEKTDCNKQILSKNLMNSSETLSLDNHLKMADTVIRGEITDIDFVDVEIRTGTAWDDKMIANGGLPKERFTEYTIEVTDTIIGNLRNGDVIKYRVLGDMKTCVTKPDGNKEICIFTKKSGEFYITVGYEHGIFEIDKNGKVYSFSNIEEFSKFDDASYDTLKKSIQEKYIPIMREKMNIQIQGDNAVTK